MGAFERVFRPNSDELFFAYGTEMYGVMAGDLYIEQDKARGVLLSSTLRSLPPET